MLGGLVVALGCAATIALAAHRIKAEEAAFKAPAAARCMPSTSNVSATLPGTTLSVSPLPDSYDASYRTQISLAGVPAALRYCDHQRGQGPAFYRAACAHALPSTAIPSSARAI